MTPEAITALAALMLEARDWIRDTHPGSYDAAVIDAAVAVLARLRRELVEAGAR